MRVLKKSMCLLLTALFFFLCGCTELLLSTLQTPLSDKDAKEMYAAFAEHLKSNDLPRDYTLTQINSEMLPVSATAAGDDKAYFIDAAPHYEFFKNGTLKTYKPEDKSLSQKEQQVFPYDGIEQEMRQAIPKLMNEEYIEEISAFRVNGIDTDLCYSLKLVFNLEKVKALRLFKNEAVYLEIHLMTNKEHTTFDDIAIDYQTQGIDANDAVLVCFGTVEDDTGYSVSDLERKFNEAVEYGSQADGGSEQKP